MSENKELPEGWKWEKLGDICLEIKSGYPDGRYNTDGKGALHFRPYNINSEGNIDLELKKFVKLKSESYLLQDSDVVFNNTNSPELLGKTCFVKNPLNWTFSNHMTRIRVKCENEPKYVAIFLQYLFYTGFYRINCSNHVNQASISTSFLSKYINIPIPEKSIQIEIVLKIDELLSGIDKGIENLKLAQQQLKTYRQSVLKWAFEGNSLVTNNIGASIKKGWKTCRLGDISKVSGGITKNAKRKSTEFNLPYLRVANVYFDKLDLNDVHTIGVNKNELERTKLEENDLLFVEGNGSIDQIGRVALWDGSIKNCVHQNHLIKARFSDRVFPKYALHFFCSMEGRNNIKKQANSTSGLHTLNLSKISQLSLPLPSMEEQITIVGIIERLLSINGNMENLIVENLKISETLKKSILKKAFEGTLV